MFITFLLVMLAATLLLLILATRAVERVERNHYLQRADFFHRYPVNHGDIVFLGDSITDGGCWDELFPGLPIKNRGINGDTTTGVLNRIDDILCCNPSAIFLLIGTNDLPMFAYRHDDDIIKTYQQILQRCKDKSPETKVFVQSILPRARRYADHIRTLNLHLEKLAEQFDYQYINLFSHFVGEQGELKSEFNNDHLHLLAAGYTLWVKILTPYIESLKLR
jgi:lysophospholipase L1-like esterase